MPRGERHGLFPSSSSSRVGLIPELMILMLMPNSFVKGSAVVRSDNRKEHDGLALSLKKVGIVKEARRNNAEEVLNNLKSFAIRKFRRFDWRPSNDGASRATEAGNRRVSIGRCARRKGTTSENKASKRARVDSTQASVNPGNHQPVIEHNPRTLDGQNSPVPPMDSATSLGLSISYSTHDASSVDHDRVPAVPTREQSAHAVDTSAIGMLCAAASVQDTIPSGRIGNIDLQVKSSSLLPEQNTPQPTSTTATNLPNGSRERIHMPSNPWVAYHSSSIVRVDRRPTEASSDVLIPNFINEDPGIDYRQLDIPDSSNVLTSSFNNSNNQPSGVPGADYSQSNIPDFSNILLSNFNDAPLGSTSADYT
jgi:hypothetical protein